MSSNQNRGRGAQRGNQTRSQERGQNQSSGSIRGERPSFSNQRGRGGPRGGQSGGQRDGQRRGQSLGSSQGRRDTSFSSQASGSSQRDGQRSYDRPSHSSGDSGGGYGRQQFGGQRSQSSSDWQRGRRDDRGGGHRGGRGGGQRGGRGRSCSPLRRDVRDNAERVDLLPELKSLPKGKKGKSVELITNHFRLNAKKELEETKICHYDITVCLRRRDNIEIEVKAEIENRQIMEKMAEEWREVLPPNTYAYDGQKNLFVIQKLGIGEEEVNREVVITLDGFPEQTFIVKIKFARNVSMEGITTSNFDANHQVIDIILRHKLFDANFVAVGRNFYNRDANDTIQLERHNCSIAFGHHQSIHNTECGLTLNVDGVTTIFRSDGPLTDFIKRELKVNDLNSVNYDNNTLRFLSKSLRDLKIFTNHIKINGIPQKRRSVIEAMASIRSDEHRFETEPGIRFTLFQYFKSKYGITLQLTEVPLIKIKGGTRENPKYLPIELCMVYPNQKMPRNLITPEIQSEMVASTNTHTPLKRFAKIQNSLETIIAESQELMDSFGFQIIDRPIKLTGREFEQPKVTGGKRGLKHTVPLTKSLFLNLSPSVKPKLNQYFDNFFNNPESGLIVSARSMRFTVNLPQITGHNLNIDNQMEAFESFIKGIKKGSVQLVFICLPDNCVNQLYGRIKYLAEVVYGILTQCITEQEFISTSPGYFNNFLLKTNAKLGGQNQALFDPQNEYRPKIFTDPKKLTMIIGADVTHPGYDNPLANERVISSIAAIVGSYDKDCTKFVANVSTQPPRTEFITDFGLMFENLLNGFFQINGKYPQNIVLFRDGVSDSQLNSVIEGEIPQMEGVYRKKKIFKPLITAYVVQKRHNTRIFLKNPIKDFKGKESFNMKPGTVVDHTITKPNLNEFHLCSHKGLIGTSCHSKYVVVRNDHNLSADELQLLAFSMCFAYCDCLTPLSIPIPVKYADLAAYRAGQYADAMNYEFDLAQPNETLDQKRERETRNIRLLNERIVVDETIKFLPYYA